MPGHGPCQLWGVLNVTPDSFSDGGRYLEPASAIAHGRAMLAAGADVIDVGGASSRPRGNTYGPGASVVEPAEERARVVPVVEGLVAEGAVVAVDTNRASVAQAALAAGARIVNDVSCAANADLLEVTAEAGADYVLMHSRGDGAVAGDNIEYRDVVHEVLRELREGMARARRAGVAPDRVWLDPGIGFAKTPTQSLQLLAATAELVASGQRVLVGPSCKAFIAALAQRPDGSLPPPTERQPGTDVAIAVAVLGGAAAVRVHDVAAGYQAVRVACGVRSARREERG